jgi:hypothetical protein
LMFRNAIFAVESENLSRCSLYFNCVLITLHNTSVNV